MNWWTREVKKCMELLNEDLGYCERTHILHYLKSLIDMER